MKRAQRRNSGKKTAHVSTGAGRPTVERLVDAQRAASAILAMWAMRELIASRKSGEISCPN
jgi:hypothetical protein